MPITDTPLRYPGGKSQLIPFVIDLMRENKLFYGEYAEPFAGGAGIAVKLLLDGYVSKIHLNDFDPAIFALWHSIVNSTNELCNLIANADVCIEEWYRQRERYFSVKPMSLLEKGFATLFLNRTNRSGIIKAGVIGGLNQESEYRLDCRFNKEDLIRKIRRIGNRREQISLTCLDAEAFITDIIPTTAKSTLVNLDPPYFGKGRDLYTNFYQPSDHAKLAEAVVKIERSWMVTYDDAQEIRALYRQFAMYGNRLNYSAQVKRLGTELLVLDPKLVVPSILKNAHIFESDQRKVA
jgi:DNA adenine methylase